MNCRFLFGLLWPKSRVGVRRSLTMSMREKIIYMRKYVGTRCVRDNHTSYAKNKSRKFATALRHAMAIFARCLPTDSLSTTVTSMGDEHKKKKHENETSRLQSIDSTQDIIIIAPVSVSRQIYATYRICRVATAILFDTAKTRLLPICNYRSVKCTEAKKCI